MVHQILKRERRKREALDTVPKKNGRPSKHPPGTIAPLKAANQRLRIENELMRSFLKLAEKEIRAKHFIQRFAGKYTVLSMCRFFGISESGYYAFIKRPFRDSQDEPLHKLIKQCQQKSRYTYGYRRVCLWLQRARHPCK